MSRWLPITAGFMAFRVRSIGLATEEGLSGSLLAWFFVASAVLIALNGVYVAYEFAVITAKRSAFSAPGGANKRTSVAALAAMSDLSMQLAGAQLGITMASLALGFVGEPAFEVVVDAALGSAFSPEVTRGVGIVVSLSIVVFLHLVLGEMVPKNIALAAPAATLRALVLPYRVFLLLFRPFIGLLNGMANAGCRLLGVEPRDELVRVHSVSELAAIVMHSRAEGTIAEEDIELLAGALQFAQRRVGELALPLSDVTILRLGATVAQAERVVTSSGRERIPIVDSEADGSFIGYVHARDLFRIDPDGRGSPIPVELIRPMAIVDSDRPLIEVLRRLRRVKRQLAVVVVEGEAVGIISIEEVVRALLESAPAVG